jgi:TonB-linked SusC/RagA family outer membrane protein
MRRFYALVFLLLLAAVPALAQSRKITGKVVNEKGDPIPFATVKIKGSKEGVIADDNGNFSISLKGSESVLVVSSTSSKTQELTVGADSKITVTLKSTGGEEMSTVVVTAFGIKRQTKSLGYATAQLDSKDLNSSQPANVASGISGKVSGANIQQINSGVNPDNIRIVLRGNRSFEGNNEALLVVDGIPTTDESYLAQINPSDIESLNILKGATAAALYGSQAANGVIIVTTKAGRHGRPTINFSSTATFDKVSILPAFQYGYGSASTEYSGSDAISFSDPSNFQNGYVPFENQSFGAPFSQGSPFGGDSVIIGIPTAGGKIQKVPYSGLANEFKDFWKTGKTFQNGLSYSGGDDNSTFFVSAQNLNRTGIVPNDTYVRNTVRANGSRKYGAFKISANVSYSASNTNTGGLYNVYNNILNIAPMVPYDSYSNVNADFADINTFYNAYGINPYWYIYNQRDVAYRSDLLGNVEGSLDATSWLNVDYVFGVKNYAINEQSTQAAFNFSPYAIWMGNNTLSGNMSIYQGMTLPQVANYATNDYSLYSNLKINLHKSFGDFNTSLILGNTVSQERYNWLYNGSTTLLNISDFYNVNFREGTPSVGQSYQETRSFGNYADLSVNWKNAIFLHGSARGDATGNRTYFYPGVDAAVVLSDLIRPIHESKVISFLKVRGGVTKTGNISIGAYAIDNTFLPANGFPFGNLAGLTTNTAAGNLGLKPEFTVANEVGAEIGFLHNRIDLQGTYFKEKTTSETVPISVTPTTGYLTSIQNVGEMDNSGEEIDLKVTPLKLANGLRWDIGFHYSHLANKVVSLNGTSQLNLLNANGTASNSFAVVGKPYTSLLLTDWERDPQGHVIVNANTGYPTISPTLVNFGTTNPTQMFGINTAVSFKGFTLSAVAEYHGGNMVYNSIGTGMDVLGVSMRSAMFAHTKFVYPNSVIEEGGKYVPNPGVQLQDAGIDWWSLPGSMYATSGAFWALRNASLTYSVPSNYVRKLKVVQAITIGVVGSNLLMWRPSSNVWTNPEYSDNVTGNATGTNSLSEAPPTRTFGANLNITF